jgi:hypothetical protein
MIETLLALLLTAFTAKGYSQSDYDAPEFPEEIGGIEEIVTGKQQPPAEDAPSTELIDPARLETGKSVAIEIEQRLPNGTRQGFTAGGATGGAVAAFTLTHAPENTAERIRGVIVILIPSTGKKPTHLHLPLDPPAQGDTWDLSARLETAEKAGKWPARIPAMSTLMVQLLKKNGETSGAPLTAVWE